MNKFQKILSAAVFCSADDIFGDAFAVASREFVLNREETQVPTVNFSVFKGVLLSRERVASLMGINPSVSEEKFREKFSLKISSLTEEQAQAVLTICQVRSMGVPVETNLKIGYGSPVFASFVPVTRAAFLAGSDTELSTLGRAQQLLGMQPSDEEGLQLMLSPRVVTATRNIARKTAPASAAADIFNDDDDDDDDNDPTAKVDSDPTAKVDSDPTAKGRRRKV